MNRDLLTAEIHTDRGIEIVGIEVFQGEPVRVHTDGGPFDFDSFAAITGAAQEDVSAIRRRAEATRPDPLAICAAQHDRCATCPLRAACAPRVGDTREIWRARMDAAAAEVAL